MPIDDPIPPEEPTKPDAPEPDDGPPQTEETRWRQRAMQAEAAAEELRTTLESARRELSEAHEAIDACELRRAIDAALFETDTVDLETARLLTEAAVMRMPDRDVSLAVGELRRRKPFLFRAAPGAVASAQSARASGAGDDLAGALEEASVTGDRSALLRYLRLKRRASA